MPIEAVIRQINLAAIKPLRKGRITPVEDGIPGFEPVEFCGCQVGPEPSRIGLGFVVKLLIGVEALDGGLAGECGARRERAVFLEDGFDRWLCHGCYGSIFMATSPKITAYGGLGTVH